MKNKNKKKDWDYISMFHFLSEDFIAENRYNVNWLYICSYQKLSERFMDEYGRFLLWSRVSYNQVLSEKFIERHAWELDWYGISQYQKLSEEFIERHKDKIYFSLLSINGKINLSPSFIYKYREELDIDTLIYLKKITKSELNKIKNKKTVNNRYGFIEI